MTNKKPIRVVTSKDIDDAQGATFIALAILLGICYGVGWKLSGKTDLGGYIGLGIGFVGSMFINAFRELIFILTFFFGAIFC